MRHDALLKPARLLNPALLNPAVLLNPAGLLNPRFAGTSILALVGAKTMKTMKLSKLWTI